MASLSIESYKEHRRRSKTHLRVFVTACILSLVSLQPKVHLLRHRRLQSHLAMDLKNYTQKSIMETAEYFHPFQTRLLVFDGNKFEVFGIMHNETGYFDTTKYTSRYVHVVPLLVKALREQFPDRFQPGQPVFQLLFSDGDSPQGSFAHDKACPVDQFSPMLFFGSTPRDESEFPTLKALPHTLFIECLSEYKIRGRQQCVWRPKVNQNIVWDDLIDTLIWRGSDFPFMSYHKEFRFEGPHHVERLLDSKWKNWTGQDILNELNTSPAWRNEFTPRWKAVLLSALAETNPSISPWIDAKFASGNMPLKTGVYQKLAQKGVVVAGDLVSASEMSRYKYQIDLGGGGGTTWEGTLSKLRMPGVLFHHETLNKDWFYDLMVPWKHFIPVQSDLGDLHSKLQIAQSNPDWMKNISVEASKLADFILSKEYMDSIYQESFVDLLGKFVRSFTPSHISWESAVSTYEKFGFYLYSIGICSDENLGCVIQVDESRMRHMPW